MEHQPGETGRPHYDHYSDMSVGRRAIAAALARQVIRTCHPWLPGPVETLDVLDIGSGYGDTAIQLAQSVRSVLGLEPARQLVAAARRSAIESGCHNVFFEEAAVEQLSGPPRFDLIVLDNVFEHIQWKREALANISDSLRPGGVIFILVPNKLWPIEAHYHLPFLGWLPLPLANRYLKLSGRGTDYADASFAPTWWELRRRLRERPELSWQFVLPGDRSATISGSPLHYRMGMKVLERAPILWSISKALLIVAVKGPVSGAD